MGEAGERRARSWLGSIRRGGLVLKLVGEFRAQEVGRFRLDAAQPQRPDRLVGMLVPAFFADLLDLWILLEIALWALAIAATVTVAQRIWVVRRQALARAGSAG